jgi:RNA polymerase sigma factor (sigma-70 family)
LTRQLKGSELARLLERCKKGDARSWERLVDVFQNLVLSIPARLGLGQEDCEDVFQNTFVALYANLDRMRSGEALPRWLAVTAYRESLRVLRGHKQAPLSDSEEKIDSLESVEKNAEELLLEATRAEAVREAVRRLPKRCQQLLELLFSEAEPSYAEISKRLNMPLGAIGPTRARCLEKLRAELEKMGVFDD